MTDRELMQQALDALEGAIDAHQNEINDHITKYGEWYRPQRVEFMRKELANTEQTIEALRARLAQPEPEPVAWRHTWNGDEQINKLPPKYYGDHWKSVPLYTAPPQREWQGLTDEEKLVANQMWPVMDADGFIRAIEAKLKERNCK